MKERQREREKRTAQSNNKTKTNGLVCVNFVSVSISGFVSFCLDKRSMCVACIEFVFLFQFFFLSSFYSSCNYFVRMSNVYCMQQLWRYEVWLNRRLFLYFYFYFVFHFSIRFLFLFRFLTIFLLIYLKSQCNKHQTKYTSQFSLFECDTINIKTLSCRTECQYLMIIKKNTR